MIFTSLRMSIILLPILKFDADKKMADEGISHPFKLNWGGYLILRCVLCVIGVLCIMSSLYFLEFK